MKVKEKSYVMDMCSGSVLRKMLMFAVPLVCSSVLQLLFNAADIVVVGRFAGDNSLAAVGSNTALINLLTNLFIGLSVGANVLTGLSYGAKKDKDLSETVHTAMLLSVFSGILLTIGGILTARQILIWMQAPSEVLNLATLYLKIYFIGMPGMMIYNFGSAILRAVGDTKRPLFYLSGAGVVNVALNLLFVIGMKMDVAGVAAATVISEYISAVLIVRCLMKEESGIRLIPAKLHIHKDKLLRILKIGLPAGFQGIIFSLANVMIQSSVNLFGATVVAGNSAAANIEGFVYVSMNAFYQSTLSFTSQNMGAGKKERIQRILLSGQICVIVVGLIFGNACVIFGRQLLSVYSSSSEVIAAGMDRMKVISSTYALCGMMDVMVGTLRGVGYSVMPMIVSLVGACGLRLVWLATVFQIEAFHNVQTIYISYPISWMITLSAHIICFLWVRRRLQIGRKTALS